MREVSRCGESVIEDEIHNCHQNRSSIAMDVETNAYDDHGNGHADSTEQQALSAADSLDE